ncbi:hypothetical protein ACQKNX_24580 [Lysinibacillus sp. NPDC093712]|uniref:hypothetical protein n=1 Tax=Lysinibacillus sp. NPDC093712 TaxID=3390579 RepID=UPI003D0314FC
MNYIVKYTYIRKLNVTEEIKVNKIKKPIFKRWQFWVGVVAGLIVLGLILPDPPADKEITVETEDIEVTEKDSKVGTEKPEATKEPKKITPLSKDEVLENFEVEPYLNGTFTFVGDRTETADYYSLADTEQFRNASIIFKDGQIARVKLIPGDIKNVDKIFEDFGVKDEPRKLSGAAGFYEVALIPKYWSQNIEKYPYDLD